jgi:hypothetical protein
VALLKEVMAAEEERSEVKGQASSVPAHGKRPMSGSATPSSDDHSSEGEEDIDTNVGTTGVEEGRQRELTPAASSSSNDDDIALSSLIRCVSS